MSIIPQALRLTQENVDNTYTPVSYDPGPGAYDAGANLTFSATAQVTKNERIWSKSSTSFGDSERAATSSAAVDSPGPGSYDPKFATLGSESAEIISSKVRDIGADRFKKNLPSMSIVFCLDQVAMKLEENCLARVAHLFLSGLAALRRPQFVGKMPSTERFEI